jgi:putative ABC transport system permease protein
MVHEFRSALLSLRRRPFLAAAVILTVGLGVGANTAIFRAFNAAFLRPLPFPAEEELVRVYLSAQERTMGLSPRPDVFLALREHSRSFRGIVAQRFNDFTLGFEREPQQIAGIEVSEGWAETLGISAQLGRTFTKEEHARGRSAGVVVISDSLWRGRFGATSAMLGRTITLNGEPFEVVGVLPPGLRFPYESEVWVPARFDLQAEGTWGLHIVGRLRVGIDAATAELRALSERLPEVRAHRGTPLTPVPLRETLIDDGGPVVMAVTVAAVFLLLLIVVNVAHLLAAHSLSRQREFAIRAALGAGFGWLLRQTMAEGLVLAAAAGAVGLGIGAASTRLLAFLVPDNFTYVFADAPLDARAIAFAIALVLVAGCLFGIVPALRAVRGAPQESLIGGRGTTASLPVTRRSTFASATQLALALVLLVAAHAIVRDVQRRLARDLGYDPRGLLTANVVLPPERYPGAEERNAFFDQLTESLRSLPGVSAAGTVNHFPAAGQGALIARIEGEGVAFDPDAPLLAHNRFAHGDVTRAIGLRVVAGRLMTADELRRGDAVVVISQSLARALWRDANPIGRRLRDRRNEDPAWLRVVGVVADLEEFYADTQRAVWQPLKRQTAHATAAQAVIVLRSSVATEALTASLRTALGRVDPSLALFDVATAEELYRASLAGRESARTLTGAFAALGLLIAAIGVYASMAFAMSRRTREIAVRMALGAAPGALVRQFLGASAAVVGAGVAGGILLALTLARVGPAVAREFPVEIPSLALAAAVLAAVALLASWMPLRRILRLDPLIVLQSE